MLAHPIPFVKLFFQDFANFFQIRYSFAPPAGDLHILARRATFVKLYFPFFALFMNQKGASQEAPFLPYFLSHIINQTVAAFVSLIDNRKASTVVFITEGEEVVSQQIHLHDSFFPGHRLKVELLGLDDA